MQKKQKKQKRKSAPVFTFIFCSSALLFFCSSAPAQLSRFDKSTLIDGLREEGMREMLKHFAETELGDDPILQKQVLLSQHMLDYEEFLDDGDIDGAVDAFEQAADISRAMIQDHYDHEQRPIWQTQLAETLLLEGLGAIHRNADRFYEFGVPTQEQADAFATAAVESLELLEDADVRFAQLQTDLPKDEDHTEKRIDTGLWNRMIEEFYSVRTQYLLTHALYYAWLLPDDHAYFKNLGSNIKIVRQKKSVADERKRLLALSQERLEDIIRNKKADNWDIEPACRSLLGRVRTSQGKPADGLEYLIKSIEANAGDMQDLWAHLGIAYAHAKAGRHSEALTELKDDAGHPMATANLLLKLLVIDARHRVLLMAAEKKPAGERPAAVAEAYRPYSDLWADPALGESRDGLREYIQRRWVSSIDPKTNLSQMPAMVVAAMGRMLRIDGQNLTVEAIQQEDESLAKQAGEKLQRAYKVNSDLLKRKDLIESVRADAMFNQAVALYFLYQDDVTKILAAANIMVDLADRFPEEAVGREAISSAVAGVLHPLHANSTPVAGANEAYRRAVDVLLGKYAGLPAAADERFYFAVRVLIPGGELDRAIEVLSGVPAGHVNYYEARRELLYVRLAQLKAAPSADASSRLVADAKQVESQASGAAAGEDGASALNAAGHARLIQVDLAAMAGKVDQAVQLLAEFEQEYITDAELIREALGRRIALLARAGRFEDSAAEAEKMMKRYPDDAAPIIDTVLTDLDTLSGELRHELADELVDRKREALTQRIGALAETARKLAQLLVDWAKGQGFAEDDMVPYQLLLARSMRLAGKPDDAMGVLEPLNQRYPMDADVMHETAETYFVRASKDDLIRASNIYSTLIEGLPMDEEGQYPSRYFNAWMRFFQINEKLNENTEDIALTIRQLELTDPNLGGEPYKSEMVRLRGKFGR